MTRKPVSHFDVTRRRTLMLAATIALSLSAVGGLSGCDQLSDMNKPKAGVKFNGVDITGATYAQQLRLKDFDGRMRDLSEFKGKVVFVFFGFTQCPDVCPTTMAELAELRRRLGPDGNKVQGVFVSVDPERDTPQVLKGYLQAMDPSFVGLTGSPEEIQAVSREFKVFYQKVETPSGGYTIDHTAGSYIFDPQGQVRLFARYGMPLDQLTADVRQLLALPAVVASAAH
ncbi:SCO family protein [Aquabacterium sp.]|uniref:SCO family protein n=1 Tax=Aquabacterium sp. TaxID=1872578 RepID=UPI0027B9CF52|nr:SCO family protein [Aquabacterium sp.]